MAAYEGKAETNQERKKNTWLAYMLPALLVCVSFFIFPSLSLYYQNTSEFYFGGEAIIKVALIGLAVVFAVLSLLGFLLRKKRRIFQILTSVTFSIGLALYLQYNFFNPAIGTLDGKAIVWSDYTKSGLISLAVWVICLAVPLLCTLKFKETAVKFESIAAALLAVLELTTVITLAVTTPPAKLSDFTVTNANRMKISDENIVVFVLDTVGQELFEDLQKTAPECSDKQLQDFVSFTNCISGGSPTIFGLPLLLTGKMYNPDQFGDAIGSYKDYQQTAFDECPLYRDLHADGYNIGLYTGSCYMQGVPTDTLDNIAQGEWDMTDWNGFTKTLYRFCAFLTFPQYVKQPFWGYTSQFNEYVTVKGYEGDPYAWSSAEDKEFYDQLCTDGLQYTKGEKNYRLYHLVGSHDHSLNENMELVSGSTVEQQARGEFKLVEEYIQQLKDLGIYDNTTIVITADHGDRHEDAFSQPMVLVKQRDYHGAFSKNDAPIQFTEFPATLAAEAFDDYSAYGESYFDVKPDEYATRVLMVHRPLLNQTDDITEGYDPESDIVKFEFMGKASAGNFKICDDYYCSFAQ